MIKDYTDITLVLDRSGSMDQVREATITGVNTLVTDQQAVPGKGTFTLAQFDDEYDLVLDAVPLAQVRRLKRETYVPRGNTALLGAIGRTIEATGKRLEAMPEPERPARVVFIIVTDGFENYSHYAEWAKAWANRDKVMQMIKHQRDNYQWEFVFVGANQDAIAAATSLGISGHNAMSNIHDAHGTNAMYAAVSGNLRSYRSGTVDSMEFTAKQREEQKDATE